MISVRSLPPFSDLDALHEHSELESLLSQICYAFSQDGRVDDNIAASAMPGSNMEEIIACPTGDPSDVIELVEEENTSHKQIQEASISLERGKTFSRVDDAVGISLENARHPQLDSSGRRASFVDEHIAGTNDENIGAASLEKEYSCKQCGKRFKNRRANAAAHIREVHLQIRMNACLLCNYKSNRTSNVSRHVRSRHGVPFLTSTASAMRSAHNMYT